jgi:dipeptidyl aminopeptidase/acylaminoacyl peptidase
MYPFDAARGRLTGPGRGVTSPGMEAWGHGLSRDGKKLVFDRYRAGKWELWETSLPDGPESPIFPDDSYSRYLGQWSPDGNQLAYVREKPSTGEFQIVEWSSASRNEELLAPTQTFGRVFDWSFDGKRLLMAQVVDASSRTEVWSVPVAGRPHAGTAAQKIIADRNYYLYQSHYSPDGRWIVFEAVRDQPSRLESTVYVMAADRGPWRRITDGQQWDDKPVWAPDGKAIYFVSGHGGFFNVWGIRFDPGKGTPVGNPFPVTSFESPALMIPKQISRVQLSLTQDRLVITVAQVSGSIWVLENVDR